MKISTVLSAAAAIVAAALPVGGQAAESCRAGTPAAPATLLDRANTAMGVGSVGDRVLHMKTGVATAAAEQSERWYPPFLTGQRIIDNWVDPANGVSRTTLQEFIWPVGGAPGAPTATLSSATAAYLSRDTTTRAVGTVSRDSRSLDPWLIVADWKADGSVKFAGECLYRDKWRAVLTRTTVFGPERLYVDRTRGFPTKLEFDELHYLWGQIHVENVYSDWVAPTGGKASYPGSTFRVEDGVTIESRTVSGPTLALVPRDSAPRLALPANAPDMRKPASRSYAGGSPQPDTVRIGVSTFLLVNRLYTETVSLQKDTVFLLDATSGEERARQDSSWIERLFPGKHPVVVVVTDLAWPHVAGVRFWTARGATIVSHAQSRGFLQQVTARTWRTPDALESSKAPRGAALRFRAVTDSMSFAGGAIHTYEIAGVGSDGALMAYIPAEHYLWASDYVQTVRAPSQYASEVLDAARRVGVTPMRFAAEHLPLTEWSTLARLTPQ